MGYRRLFVILEAYLKLLGLSFCGVGAPGGA